MDKGFVIYALSNNRGVDYQRHAYALALSIKRTQKNNNTCVIVDRPLNKEYAHAFDHIVKIKNDSTDWTQNALHTIYDLSPFHETVHIESDCLLLDSVDHWWTACQYHDILFTTKIKNFRNEIVAPVPYRGHFEKSRLPNVYSGLYYFRKSPMAKKLHTTMSWVTKHWEQVRKTVFDPNQNITMANDEIAAVSIALLDLDEQVTNVHLSVPIMTHMKPRVNGWGEMPWTANIDAYLDKNFVLRLGSIVQNGVWHYQDKTFLTDEIIEQYVASIQ